MGHGFLRFSDRNLIRPPLPSPLLSARAFGALVLDAEREFQTLACGLFNVRNVQTAQLFIAVAACG
jgi:hypothetical protein